MDLPNFLLSSYGGVAISILIFLKLTTFGKVKSIIREANTPSVECKIIKSLKSKCIYFLGQFFYKYCDKFIGVSNGVSKDSRSFYSLENKKIHTIYNPVFNDDILTLSNKNLSEEWLNNDSKRVIVAMGRVQEQKDFVLLLDGFKNLIKNNYYLIILGKYKPNSKYFLKLNQIINDANMSKRIKFVGFQANPFKYLSRADLFVLTSKYEGMPSSIIQAMACGCNIVSVNCQSGPKEILENGKYGSLLKTRDSSELSKLILYRIDNKLPKDKLMKRARYFNIDNTINRYLSLKINKSL